MVRYKRTIETDLRRLRALGFSQGVATMARWLAFGDARAVTDQHGPLGDEPGPR